MEYALLIDNGERNLNFLFDICRWQVEEENVGVAREALHLCLISRPLWRPWVLKLLPLHKLVKLGVPSNLQRFIAHHPPTFIGGGDPVVADHWFRQVKRILEAMEITSDAKRIRLATFWLEGESQIWWDWVKVSRDPETMTWGEFKVLFMDKFFLAFSRHAKAWEFLELKQGSMTVLKYVAKFTKLAHFSDDYVATDMAKVQKFEDGLKLSIHVKIVGFLLQDMDSMVKTTMAIEREIEDARSIRDTIASGKRKEDQPSSSLGKKQKNSIP